VTARCCGVGNYIQTLSAKQAALAAGYANKSAYVLGCKIRSRPHVQEAIAKALGSRLDVLKSQVLMEVRRIAFLNLGDFVELKDGELIVKDHAELEHDQLAAPASIEEHVNEAGHRTIKVKPYDKLQALQTLALRPAEPQRRLAPTGPR
jgi:phage terminase small subunit